MPYIKQKRREIIKNCETFNEVLDFAGPGDLNFIISDMINAYLKSKGESYSTYNELIGVLECAKLELYRVLISKYEDKKAAENGPVY